MVGGGLLGLEAANALRLLGLDVTVVEFAPRLMAVQLDDGGAAELRRQVEAMGIGVRTGAAAAEVLVGPGGAVAGLAFTEGEPLDADIVVFAAGIRPRDGLAAEAGPLCLMKPLTYMNLSGQAVAAWLRHRPLDLQDILVITDDVNLPMGKIRIRKGGSAGGHNGLKSLIACLGSDQFPRLRIGIDPGTGIYDLREFVLSSLPPREKVWLGDSLDMAAKAALIWATEGCRAMATVAAAAFDAAHHHPDADTRKQSQAFYEFMVPLVKGYSTEMSLEVTSLGVQVHGGMGFIEETGAAQYYRDAKILTIYEGTTAIQANDLVGRKTARDGGQVARAIARQIEATEARLAAHASPAARAYAKRLAAARQAFVDVVEFIVVQARGNPNAAFAGSVPYLMLAGNVVAGWQMGQALMAAEDHLAAGTDRDFMQAKAATARFYGEHILCKAGGLRDSIVEGAGSVTAMALDAF